MKSRWKGFGERVKRLNPIWHVSTGMQLLELKEYSQILGLSVMLEVFYRELQNNPERKRQDLIAITEECILDLGIDDPIPSDLIVRFVDGLLWSGQADLQQPFKAKWFDEQSLTFKEHRFRYLVEDRQASQWERGGKTVYQCSDEAKELIFMSREILQELEITIDQLYIEHLIKNGHFHQALTGLDDLIARVKRMVARELDYRESIKRNPRMIFEYSKELRSNREQEIKKQFQEEKNRFYEMSRLLHRIVNTREQYEVAEKLEDTRRIHDQLAGHVTENMRLELELRFEFPNLFWRQANVTFEKTFYRDWLDHEGLPSMDRMSMLLSPLFSVQPEVMYSLDWSWMEQERQVVVEEQEMEIVEKQEISRKREVDWEKIVRLWEPIFLQLLETSEFKLSQWRKIPEALQQKWIEQQEAIDLWMLFHSESLIMEHLQTNKEVHDERIQLIQKLCERQRRFELLEGKKLESVIEPDVPMIRWNGVLISPFMLRIT